MSYSSGADLRAEGPRRPLLPVLREARAGELGLLAAARGALGAGRGAAQRGEGKSCALPQLGLFANFFLIYINFSRLAKYCQYCCLFVYRFWYKK